jgi:hypothetical protein
MGLALLSEPVVMPRSGAGKLTPKNGGPERSSSAARMVRLGVRACAIDDASRVAHSRCSPRGGRKCGGVFARFREMQWTRLPAGEPTSVFIELVRRLVQPDVPTGRGAANTGRSGFTTAETCRKQALTQLPSEGA